MTRIRSVLDLLRAGLEGLRKQAVLLTVVALTVSVGAVLLVLGNAGKHLMLENTSRLGALLHVQVQIARFHQRVEELVLREDIVLQEELWEDMEHARENAQHLLEGGDSHGGVVEPLVDPRRRETMYFLIERIDRLSRLARQRLEVDSQVAGSMLDVRFDATFDEIMVETGKLEAGLVRDADEAMATFDTMRFGMLPLVVILGLVAALAMTRFSRRAEAAGRALREQLVHLDTLVDSMPDALVTLNGEGGIEGLNPAARDMFGLRNEQMTGLSMTLLIPECSLGKMEQREPLTQDGSRRVLMSGREETGRRGDGSTFPLELSLSEVFVEGKTRFALMLRDISERKKAEKDLRESEARLARTQEMAHLGHFDWDIPQDVANCSEEIYRIFGFEPGQFTFSLKAVQPQVHPQDCEDFGADIEQALKTGQLRNCEARIIRPGGEVRRISLQGEVTFSHEDGSPLRMLGTMLDITETREAEQQLLAREVQLRAVFEQAAVGIAQVDPSGRWMRVNQKLCDTVGYTEEELQGMTFQEITHPDDLPDDLKNSRRVLRGEIGSYDMEKRYLKKGGGFVWVHMTVSLVQTEGGSPKYFVVVVQDISERRAAEEELEQSRQRLGLHMEHTPLAVIEWNTRFEVTRWNPAAESIFGYSSEEAMGRHAAGLVVPEHVRDIVDQVWADLLKRAGGEQSTNENITADGRSIICDWYNTPLVDENGLVIGVASLAQDITERVRAEEALTLARADLEQRVKELEASKREIQSFYHALSHELKTPLTSTREFALIIRDGLAGPVTEEQTEYLTDITEGCERMAVIINDLVDSTRIETGKLTLEVSPTEVESLIKKAVQSVQGKASEKGVQLLSSLPGKVTMVQADTTRVVQVLTNLLNNAVRYTDAEGQVLVEARLDGEMVAFSVSDTGCGIPEKQMPHIFDRFYQVSEGNYTHQGFGLGLYLCRELVRMHGGEIVGESEVGKGSAFRFTIPLVEEETKGKKHPRRKKTQAGASTGSRRRKPVKGQAPRAEKRQDSRSA